MQQRIALDIEAAFAIHLDDLTLLMSRDTSSSWGTRIGWQRGVGGKFHTCATRWPGHTRWFWNFAGLSTAEIGLVTSAAYNRWPEQLKEPAP